MKKFIVVIKQHGEGCDYTIGCAQKTVEIEAVDIQQAYERFSLMLEPNFDEVEDMDWTKDYGGYYDERALESAVIHEVVDTKKIDTVGLYAAITTKETKAFVEEQNNIEKEEYERLKKKFG